MTPVIGTTIGAMPELIRDATDGLLLETGYWQTIASTIEQIVNDPAFTIDVWRRHVPVARNMTTIAGQYIGMYRDVLAERNATLHTADNPLVANQRMNGIGERYGFEAGE